MGTFGRGTRGSHLNPLCGRGAADCRPGICPPSLWISPCPPPCSSAGPSMAHDSGSDGVVTHSWCDGPSPVKCCGLFMAPGPRAQPSHSLGFPGGESGDALPWDTLLPRLWESKGGLAEAALGKVSSSWVMLHKSRKEDVTLSQRPGPSVLGAAPCEQPVVGGLRTPLQRGRAARESHSGRLCTHRSHG